MADPISIASGVLTLVIFAHTSCLTLHTTIKSFKNHPKRVRELIEELEALIDVLEKLSDTVRSDRDADFPALELPLRRCGSACAEFLQELEKCCSQSGGDRRSFRDWTRLRYMGSDINDFRDSLAAYKSTINIALTDGQLRKSSLTLDRLGEYKELIETATNDLEARLETIDEKLETLVGRTATSSETAELQRIKAERSSTQKGLVICAQFSKLIDQLQPSLEQDLAQDSDNISGRITNDGIQGCRVSIQQTVAKLERRMQDILDQMTAKSCTVMPEEDKTYLARLREEWATAVQCRDICSKADQHLKDNTSIIDNHATGHGAVQFLVSNSQKTIHGKNRGYGDQIKQLGGHLSDDSIQKVSGDFLQMTIHWSENRDSSAHDGALSEGNDAGERKSSWQPHYGSGRTLKSQPSPSGTIG